MFWMSDGSDFQNFQKKLLLMVLRLTEGTVKQMEDKDLGGGGQMNVKEEMVNEMGESGVL